LHEIDCDRRRDNGANRSRKRHGGCVCNNGASDGSPSKSLDPPDQSLPIGRFLMFANKAHNASPIAINMPIGEIVSSTFLKVSDYISENEALLKEM
jgi:hypothetical protein